MMVVFLVRLVALFFRVPFLLLTSFAVLRVLVFILVSLLTSHLNRLMLTPVIITTLLAISLVNNSICARARFVRVQFVKSFNILCLMKNGITLEQIIKAVTALITAVWTIIQLFVVTPKE